eukprot:558453-Amphidinium_carterae.1
MPEVEVFDMGTEQGGVSPFPRAVLAPVGAWVDAPTYYAAAGTLNASPKTAATNILKRYPN